MLLDTESKQSAVTSGVRYAVGELMDSVKRSGWELREEGRRERYDSYERMDSVLRARIMLEYSMGRCSARR